MIPISDAPGHRRRVPLVNVAFIVANIVVFVFLELGQPNERALNQLIRAAGVIPVELAGGRDLPPLAPLGSLYTTLITSMFLHGGWLHLGSNMLYLWVFGDNVEDALGHIPYLVFYGLCGIVASVAHVLLNLESNVPTVGASGAIAGVLAGYLVMYPNAAIRTLVFLGPFITVTRVSGLLLIGLWFLMQIFSGLASLGDAAATGGVAVWAHVGGFVAGFVLIQFFKPRQPIYSNWRS